MDSDGFQMREGKVQGATWVGVWVGGKKKKKAVSLPEVSPSYGPGK